MSFTNLGGESRWGVESVEFVGVDDALLVARLGQQALPARGVVLLLRVAGDHGAEPRRTAPAPSHPQPEGAEQFDS